MREVIFSKCYYLRHYGTQCFTH